MKISSVDQMRQLDQRAGSEYGIGEALLMENAGASAAAAIQSHFDPSQHRFLIVAGVGNNGGDGLVVARKLHSNHSKVKVVIVGEPSRYKGQARENYEIARKIGFGLFENPKIREFNRLLSGATVIVDAIFGTGLDREVTGTYQEVIDALNKSGKPVVSLDIPSGINGETGQVMGIAVSAEMTVTFGLPKYGNLLYPGFGHGGQLYVTHISFPPEMYRSGKFSVGTNDPVPLPPRPGDAHKGSCGKVLFIAGAAGYLGAPYFAASSFLRTGGGLAYLATPGQVAPFIGALGHEIVFVPQKATDSGSIALSNLDRLLEFSKQTDMVVMGPGLSLDPETQQLVRDLAAAVEKPLLIDGDGLTAISRHTQILRKRRAPTILTPHPGEMSRLLGKTGAERLVNKIDLIREQTHKLNSIVVLKGAHSLVGYPDGAVYVNMSGNAGMATAGSGDVLTGVMAGLFGIGMPLETAARMGVFVHGAAGDLAVRSTGMDGLLAGDILESVAIVMKELRDPAADLLSGYRDKIRVI